ncbi:MAG: ankyrin repeat domain-containing protein [Agarilytica sp.]
MMRALVLIVFLCSPVFADNVGLADQAVRLREFNKAFYLYLKEARLGHAEAQYQVAKLYLSGMGVDRNEKNGIFWLEKATDQNHDDAQYNLAVLLRATDSERSTMLLSSLASKGNVRAEKLLKKRRHVSASAKVSDTEADVFSAAKKNDTTTLKKLKQSGASIRAVDKHKRSALFWALESKEKDALIWLLKQGLAPTATDKYGISPMSYAIDVEHYTSLPALFKYAKSPLPNLPNGDTLLHHAVRKAHYATVKNLLNRSIDINAENEEGWTALDIAHYQKNKKIVALLKRSKAKTGEGWLKKNRHDVSKLADRLSGQSGKVQFSPIEDALLHENAALFSQLLEDFPLSELNQPQATEHTLLSLAVRQNNRELITALLDKGANPNTSGEYGMTPLILASKYKALDAVKILLESGAKILSVDARGRDAVSHAMLAGAGSIAVYLLNVLESRGTTYPRKQYLLVAAARNQTNMVMRLTRQSKNLDHYDENGRNAIWFASKANNPAIITRLIKAGVNPAAKDSETQTPFIVAADSGCLMCGKELITHTDINYQMSNGTSALMLAAKNGDAAFVEWLIVQGADVVLSNHSGNTALILAVEENSTEVTELLMNAGASVARKNKVGLSALDIAKTSYPELYKKMNKSAFYNIF